MIIYQNAFRVLCTLLARKVGREINDRQPYSLCVCCTKRVDTVAVSRTWTMKSNQWSVYSGCCRVRGSVAWAITVRCDDLNDAMHLISHTILNATCYWWENVIRYLVFMCLLEDGNSCTGSGIICECMDSVPTANALVHR